jgi:hypothetical protein
MIAPSISADPSPLRHSDCSIRIDMTNHPND